MWGDGTSPTFNYDTVQEDGQVVERVLLLLEYLQTIGRYRTQRNTKTLEIAPYPEDQ